VAAQPEPARHRLVVGDHTTVEVAA
jgi:hypothetical protein